MYTVRPSRSKLPENQFPFSLKDTTYSLPKLKFLKPEIAFELQGKEPAEGMKLLFKEYCPDALKHIDDGEQLNDLMLAWRDYSQEPGSELDLGESQASATS